MNTANDEKFAFFDLLYLDARARRVGAARAPWFPISTSLSVGSATKRVAANLVSGNLFEVLRHWHDDRTADFARRYGRDGRAAALSYGFWQPRFASDPGILNRVISIHGRNWTIVDVDAQGFHAVAGAHRRPHSFRLR